MFWPVNPWATIPVGPNRVDGKPRTTTCCAPFPVAAPNVTRKVMSSSASPLLSILMSKNSRWSNVTGDRFPANGDTVKTITVLFTFPGAWPGDDVGGGAGQCVGRHSDAAAEGGVVSQERGERADDAAGHRRAVEHANLRCEAGAGAGDNLGSAVACHVRARDEDAADKL